MGNGERARRPARIRRAVGALLFVAGCVSMAVCGVLSSKQQPRPDSILSEGGAPWFGRVKTLQVDADGALYIALDNHHILRRTETGDTVFLMRQISYQHKGFISIYVPRFEIWKSV